MKQDNSKGDETPIDLPPDNADSTKVLEEDSSSGSESSRDEEIRIEAVKKAIIKEEKRQFKLLSARFAKNKDVDMSMGRCCGRYTNETGAKWIQIIDIIFLPNLLRCIFALWSLLDNERYPMYSKMRLLSFWFFWLFFLMTTIVISIQKILEDDKTDAMLFVNSLIILTFVIVASIIDYHFTLVVKFYAKGHNKRKERQEKELEDKKKELEI